MVFVGIGSLLQLALLVRALVRCIAERYSVGAIGAVARLSLLVGGVGGVAMSYFASATGSGRPSPALSLMTIAAVVLGPIVSFTVLWMAHRRRANVPAAQEERLGRPFDVWLPVALLDAAYVAITVFVNVMANPFR